MLLAGVTLGEAEVRIDLRGAGLLAVLGIVDDMADHRDGGNTPRNHRSTATPKAVGSPAGDVASIVIPTRLRRRGVETKLILESAAASSKTAEPDPALVKMIANAHQWWDDLVAHRFPTLRALARAYSKNERYVARVLPLAFLAPATVEAIVTGVQPVELTAQRLIMLVDLPHDWTEQNSAIRSPRQPAKGRDRVSTNTADSGRP